MVRSIDTSQTSPPRLKLDEAALLAYMRRARARAPRPPRPSPTRARSRRDVAAPRIRRRGGARRLDAFRDALRRAPRGFLSSPKSSPRPSPPRSPQACPHFPSDVTSVAVTQFGHGQSNPTYKVDCLVGVGAPPRRRSSSARNPPVVFSPPHTPSSASTLFRAPSAPPARSPSLAWSPFARTPPCWAPPFTSCPTPRVTSSSSPASKTSPPRPPRRGLRRDGRHPRRVTPRRSRRGRSLPIRPPG